MFLPSVLLIFAVASTSASIEEAPFYETQVHPLSDEYIEYINNVQSLWQAGRNFEVDTPIEYLSHLNGAIHKDGLLALNEKEFSEDMIQNLPESFDARKQWPHCPSLTEIRNQGQCGSCWAMSSTEVMTDRTCIASHGKVEFHYSTFDLLTCCVNNTASCYGGDPDKAWQHWLDVGIVSGGNYNSKNKGCKPYPYPNTNLERNDLTQLDSWEISLNCTHQCVSADLDYNKDKRFGKSIYRLRSKEDDIKTDILNHGPVQACFHEFQDFMSYKSGVYRAVSKIPAGDHCAKILGWGVERGTKYWLVANSWGEQWGDHGYFKIVRGENHCGIESEVYAGEPLL